jgi:hypothetical protein
MYPLRRHSHAGSPYAAWSVAQNEGRALPKILVVNPHTVATMTY